MLTQTIILILWPYLFFAGCVIVFSVDGNGGIGLVVFAIVYTILSGILHHMYRKSAEQSDQPLRTTAKYNLLLKLIPAVCDAAVYGALTVSYIQTLIEIRNGAMMCVPVHLIILVILTPYNLSRIFALIAAMRVSMHLLEESRWKLKLPISRGRIWLHTILHLLPAAHIISNIIVYNKLRNIPTEHSEQ